MAAAVMRVGGEEHEVRAHLSASAYAIVRRLHRDVIAACLFCVRVNQQRSSEMANSHELQFTPSVVFELPLELETSGEAVLHQGREWIDVRADKSAVLSNVKLVRIVDHGQHRAAEYQLQGQAGTLVQPCQNRESDPAASESKSVAITVGHEVACLAFSNCGNYLAIADDSGALHLFRSSGKFLFAYPVVDSGASDRYVGFQVLFC